MSKTDLSKLKLRKWLRVHKISLRWLIVSGLFLLLAAVTASVYHMNHQTVASVPESKPMATNKTSARAATKDTTANTADTTPTTPPAAPVQDTQPTAHTTTTTSQAAPPPQFPVSSPFGITVGTLYQSYACQTDPDSSYLNIGDVNLSFSSSSGGQLTYWLEGTNVENMGSLADHHTVTVPNGTWLSTLNKLTGTYSGPHQLYTATVDVSSGDTGSVRVAIQWAGGTWYSPPVALPGPSVC